MKRIEKKKIVDGIEEPEDLLEVLRPTKEASEEYKLITSTLASTDPEKLMLFSDLTRGQIYWMGMTNLFIEIVKKVYDKDLARILNGLIISIEARSVSHARGGRKEIVEALKPKAIATAEEKEELKKKLEEVIK